MSRFDNVYDAALSTMAALFPSKTRIIDAYDLENNIENVLKNGWGLKLGNSIIAPGEINNFVNQDTFTIVLTREVLRMDTQVSKIDDQVKNLRNDSVLVQEEFYKSDELGAEADIRQIILADRSEIGTIVAKKTNFIFLEVNFGIQITEEI